MKIKCPYCEKEYSNKGIGTHIWRCHTDSGKKFDPNKRIKSGELIQWNKDKHFEETYNTEQIIKLKASCSIGGKSWKGKHHSEKTKEKLSKIAKKNNLGGITKGGGRGKHGWYKGYWCDSSWELAWVIYQLDHNIKFERNTSKFSYFFNNKKCNYIPDFKIDDEYYEIKGWKEARTLAKIRQFPEKLNVLYREDLEEIFDYVNFTYGTNWIELYEKEKKKTLK